MALTKKQQQRLQVCENKWVRIAGVKSLDRRRIDELSEEIRCADEFDGEIGEILPEMGWTHGADGGRERSKIADSLR